MWCSCCVQYGDAGPGLAEGTQSGSTKQAQPQHGHAAPPCEHVVQTLVETPESQHCLRHRATGWALAGITPASGVTPHAAPSQATHQGRDVRSAACSNVSIGHVCAILPRVALDYIDAVDAAVNIQERPERRVVCWWGGNKIRRGNAGEAGCGRRKRVSRGVGSAAAAAVGNHADSISWAW